MESNRYTVSGPVRQSALMRPSMIKPEVNSTKMNHEVIDTQNTEQDHRKFLETGDDALYSAENMRKRAALKEDPQIRAWITMFFRTFSMQTKPWCAGHKNVTRYQVFAFELLCCKALFPPAAFNMEEALCSVEEDLQRDLGDREQMSFHEFSESLFEIVDMWTLTCEKDEYLIFLRNLYLRISEPSITGSRQFRRVDAVVSVYAPAPPVVSATQPKRSLRELAARAGAEGPKRGAPRRFPDPVLEARICRGSPPLASTRQLVPGDPGSLTLSPSAPLDLSPSPPNSPRKRAPNRAVRVVEVGADPRGAASRH